MFLKFLLQWFTSDKENSEEKSFDEHSFDENSFVLVEKPISKSSTIIKTTKNLKKIVRINFIKKSHNKRNNKRNDKRNDKRKNSIRKLRNIKQPR